MIFFTEREWNLKYIAVCILSFQVGDLELSEGIYKTNLACRFNCQDCHLLGFHILASKLQNKSRLKLFPQNSICWSRINPTKSMNWKISNVILNGKFGWGWMTNHLFRGLKTRVAQCVLQEITYNRALSSWSGVVVTQSPSWLMSVSFRCPIQPSSFSGW